MSIHEALRKSSPATEAYRQRRLANMKRKRSDSKQKVMCALGSPLLHELKEVSNCIHCDAKRFEYEPPTFCCDNGKITLSFSEVPDELYGLFTSESQEAINFRRSIRSYNSIFSFTSFGVKLDKDLASARRGVYSFRAQGMVYHDLPGLIPRDTDPNFFQLYFYETGNEVQNRMNILQNQNISEAIVQKLIKILEVNPYAKVFRRLKDCPSMDNVQLLISKNVNLDQRVYNSPHEDQVAAIWVEGNNDNIPLERDIIVHSHSGERHRIKHYYGCYDPLQYPILFPKGEPGWHQSIKKSSRLSVHNMNLSDTSTTSGITTAEDVIAREQQGLNKQSDKNISCREYVCYKLQIRNPRRSILLFAGRLLQQLVVDMYIKLETTRLDFYRQNQSTMRAELYQGIVDSVFKGELRGNEVGKRIVLPATFIGGPRDMRRRYLDALALVQRFGKPDLFITMTCNPEWKEIQDNLYVGQTAQDRPDLTSRIFRAKLQALRDQLFKNEIFGHVAAHVHVIEFQKRGLPHVHMLIIFQPDNKIHTSDEIDKYVSAELPDQEKDPLLFELVKKHMMHGPCGEKNPKNSCMVKGKCKCHYPRSYCESTIHGKDGYPIYRRRKKSSGVRVRGADLDNRWVVPYNPYLLSTYNCHINVEVCSGITAVKYLYKYIYKGHDKVAIHVAREDDKIQVDEIKQFQDARWVSAQEAMWRIYEFGLNDICPAVINLQLHLPNKQFVAYHASQNLENLIAWDHVSKTMLTEYFAMCATSDEARKYLYREFPEHYVWDKKSRCWTARKRGTVIGRISAVNPIEGERYYEKLLLNHVRGVTSFRHLMTVKGVEYSNFKEAAQQRGLLEADESIVECLNEAVAFQMPNELRRLFAIILVHCSPTEVRNLWDIYFDALSEDFKRETDTSFELRVSKTLKSLSVYLEGMGKHINLYDLPEISVSIDTTNGEYSKELQDEMSIQTPEEDHNAESKLNDDQRHAFEMILSCIRKGNGGIFFIDGPGGTGKTFLYRALLAHIRLKNLIALATATSGVAAGLMPGGRTAHSRFKIPINADESSECSVSKQSATAELLRQAQLILWDEAPMAKKWAIENVNKLLKDVMSNDKDFGGKVIVFGGDFRQVLPVVPRATIYQTISASLVKSYLWPKMRKITLSMNMRSKNDPIFSEFLLRVGNGEEPMDDEGNIKIPSEMVIEYDTEDKSIKRLIEAIFPNLEKNSSSADYMTSRAILTPKNEQVDKLNDELISMFPGDAKVFNSFDEALDETRTNYETEFLNSLTPNGLPPHKLILKKNCPIILLRNLDPSNGLCNGTRMVCREFKGNIIKAEIMLGQHIGKHVLIPRIPLSPAENESYPFQFRRKQFPIRLCFAMTINKAQGQTIPNVGVYLPFPVFSHGQLYVALSRGTSMSTTKVLIKSETTYTRGKMLTKNIVYTQVLTTGHQKNQEDSADNDGETMDTP